MVKIVIAFGLVISFVFSMPVYSMDRASVKKQLADAVEAAEEWLLEKKHEHLLELNQLRKEDWGQTIYQQPSVEKLRQHVLSDFLRDIDNYFVYFDEVVETIVDNDEDLNFSEISWLSKEYKDYIDFKAKCAVEVQKIKGE